MELVVQYEYSAVQTNEVSVQTGEHVQLIDRDGQGWITIEKNNRQRGQIPEDWVVMPDGASLAAALERKPELLKKLPSAAASSKSPDKATAEARAARKKRVAILKRKLTERQVELTKKQKALEDLEEFLLQNQSASESARMAMVEEEMSDFDDGDDDFYDEEEAGGAAEAGAGADPARAPSTRRSAPGTKRTNVVKEIYESELSYGTDLKLIIEQFLQPLAQKAEVFNSRVLEILFSNILEILTLHTTFVQALGSSIGLEPSFKSEIGKVFALHADSFKLYAVYCANHNRASEHLDLLNQSEDAYKILEACRLLAAARTDQGHQSGIGLGGYLLTPIQRICKYPLLLRELLKATPADHADHASVASAMEKMTVVALSINEDKRNTEHLMIIQDKIAQWKGPPLVETSSTVIGEGLLQKISGGKTQERMFYLFDNLLVYCKQTGSGKLIFRGRIPTDCISVKPVADGKFEGKSYQNGMMFENPAKDSKYVVYGSTPQDKVEWLKWFRVERDKVMSDSHAGIDRRSRERLNTAAPGQGQRAGISRARGNTSAGGNFRSQKLNKKKSAELNSAVSETVEEFRQDSAKVAQFKPVDVRMAISKDSLVWAGKSALLFPRSKVAVIQEILDKFMLSHMSAEDFELVQQTSAGDQVMPDEPIPLFALAKSEPLPYNLYLHHIQLGDPSSLVYPDHDGDI